MNIKSFFTAHLKIILGTLALICVVGGVIWYLFSSTPPTLSFYTVNRGTITTSVDIPGTVSSGNSVSLSFQESGEITSVNVQEGQSVVAGEALTSLDDSTQETALSQEQAALNVQTANLASLEEGTRPEQLAVADAQVNSDQTALTQANQSVMNAIQTAYTTSDGAIADDVNLFIDSPQSVQPTLVFTTNNPQLQNTFLSEYVSFETILTTWQSDIASTSDVSALETESQTNLGLMTQLLSDANGVLNDAISSTQVSQSSINAWIIDIATMRADVNTVSSAFTSAVSVQQNAAATLNKDQKNLLLEEASSTSATIDAQQAQIGQVQAQIDSAELAVEHATIFAPFSGIVRDVIAEPGMVVSPDVPVLSIINNGIMKIDAYASANQIPFIQGYATATVTLDPYGNTTKFLAKVTAVDTAATTINEAPAYHVTLYFTQADSKILAGMTGNVTILTGEHDNVIEIPSGLVLGTNDNTFVLMENGGKIVERQVTVGLTGDDGMVEIVSGLNAGDKIIDF